MIQPKFRPSGNILLDSLLRLAGGRLAPHIKKVGLGRSQVVFEQGEPLAFLYFPAGAVVSLVYAAADGKAAEVCAVGSSGVLDAGSLLGADAAQHRAVVTVRGAAYTVPASRLAAEAAREAGLRALLAHYALAHLTEVRQLVACSRLHSLEERLCRWLLRLSDCAGAGGLAVTHERAAELLGVRRSGVSAAARALKEEGVIGYRWGAVEILRRAVLEERTCECYGLIVAAHDRLDAGLRTAHRPALSLVENGPPGRPAAARRHGLSRRTMPRSQGAK